MPTDVVIGLNGSAESRERGEEHLLLSNSGPMLESQFVELKGDRREYPVSRTVAREIGSTYGLPGMQGATPLPVYSGSNISIDIPARYRDLIVTGSTADNRQLQWVQNTSCTGRPATIVNNASILTTWIA